MPLIRSKSPRRSAARQTGHQRDQVPYSPAAPTGGCVNGCVTSLRQGGYRRDLPIVFTPSFLFLLSGGHRIDRIRASVTIQSFLAGASPAVIGAIAGSAIPLGLAFRYPWQTPVLAGALLWFSSPAAAWSAACCWPAASAWSWPWQASPPDRNRGGA